jgi:3-hydroxyisobutyrate dehydrogenase-like beta-hydroxyacid dehydrogenase
LQDTAAEAVDTLDELGARCDVVGVCVTDDAGVTEVVTNVVPSMRAGTTVLIHSTVLPATARHLATWAAERGIDLIDAPVSGGSDAALEGRMAVLVGGPQEILDRVHEVIAHFAKSITLLGPVGAGAAAKLINNVLMMANGGVLVEAVAVGAAAGVGRADLLDALSASSGGSYVLNRQGKHTDPSFAGHAARLLRKDLKLFEEMTQGSAPLLVEAGLRYVEFLDGIAAT